jgi:hypothetical protein
MVHDNKRIALRCIRSLELAEHIFLLRVAKELANPPRHRGALSVGPATGSRHPKTNFTCARQAVARTGHNAERLEFLD